MITRQTVSSIETHLENLADTMGIQLIQSNRLNIAFNSVWHPTSRTIVARQGLDPATRVSAITHELGHAHFGHDCSSERTEREADEWAALRLLDSHMVEEVARECDFAPLLIASELRITPHLLAT